MHKLLIQSSLFNFYGEKIISQYNQAINLSKHPKPIKQQSKPTPIIHQKVENSKNNKKVMQSGDGDADGGGGGRLALSEVVSDCVKRWFKDTLKEAKAGDINMQVLVGQMYFKGYGVSRDAQKGRIWMTRASKTRTSVWKVSDKHPGYNASDSDSDELKGDS